MMNLRSTEKIIQQHFSKSDFQKIDNEGVFKVNKRYKDHLYQILYVDCKEKWNKENLDLSQYQEKYLLNDYYKNSGYLQWNNYFIFLSDESKIKKHQKEKEIIERNDIYSRKYVMTIDEFDDWLKKNKDVGVASSDKIKVDLSTKWIKILSDAKLDCVFSNNVTYKEGVEKFLKDKPYIEKADNERTEASPKHEHISNFEKLILDNYRKYPKEKEFDFRKINLIKGVNASGKTSLLEAIELILCGKTYRNPKENCSQYKLKAKLNENDKFIEFEPDNTRLYKNRDEYWYNNPYHTRSIETHRNFKKYNFFNSDAAFELSNESNRFDVRKAFEDIALGDMVNYIEERLNGYLDRFQTKFKNYNKDLDEWEFEIEKEEKIINQISEIDDNPEKFYQEFLKECKKYHWTINEDSERDQLFLDFEKDYLHATQLIESIKNALDWLEIVSQDEVQEELERYERTSDSLEEIEKKVSFLKKERAEKKEEYSNIKAISDQLEGLEKYFESSNVDQLIGLGKNIENISDEVKKQSRLQEIAETITYDHINNRSDSISNYKKELTKEFDDLKEEQKQIIKKIETTKEGLKQLEQIVTEIKSKGREFIKEFPEATECPLCHTDFEESKLAKRIEEVHKKFKHSDLLETYLRKENNLNTKIKSKEKEINNLSLITNASFILYGDEHEDENLNKFIKDIEGISEELIKNEEKLNELKLIKQDFDDKGLTEEDFKDLKSNLKEEKITIENKEDLKKSLKSVSEKSVSIQEFIHKSKEELNELIKENDEVLNEIIEKNTNDAEEIFNKRLKDLRNQNKHFSQLNKLIAFRSTTAIEIIDDQASILYKHYKKVKDLFKDKEQNEIRLKAANKKIEDLKKKIVKNRPIRDRAQKAVSVIENILNNHSKSDFLSKFFEDNRDEIVDIFKLIHSPKEFIDLNFNQKNKNEIVLKRDSSKKSASLKEISSGQRSALALSIFLALNKKLTNGPDVLLFDDPVTTIDDLNALSFLDYLRELAINSNRQIFFATANDDLAYLFKKKFEFLGDKSFREFELERN